MNTERGGGDFVCVMSWNGYAMPWHDAASTTCVAARSVFCPPSQLFAFRSSAAEVNLGARMLALDDVEKCLTRAAAAPSTSTTAVRLPCNPIRTVPVALRRFSHLTELDMAQCDLTSVAFFVDGSCRTLQVLNLAFNNISVADPLCCLTRLQRLNLTGNVLTRVPPALKQLAQLRILHLSGNDLERTFDLTALSKLSILSLANNSRLPPRFRTTHCKEKDTQSALRSIAQYHDCQVRVYTLLMCWNERFSSDGVLSYLPRDMIDYLAKVLWEMELEGFPPLQTLTNSGGL